MSQRKVLLVWPEFPVTYWGFQYALRIFGKKAMHPPLGLITVAALCPSGWEFRLADLNVTPLTDDQIRWADLVFVSGMGIQQPSMFQVLERVRSVGRTSVVGGSFASENADRLKDRADVLVLGEAEVSLAPFLADLERGRPKPLYEVHERPDLSTSPVPRFDLLDLSRYAIIDVQFSRGCPFNCEFCDIITLYGRTPRTKPVDTIIREFEALHALGYRGPLFLVDDNFIGNKGAVRALLDRIVPWMQEHHYPFFLTTEASINLADDAQLLSKMRLAGFKRVFIGVETPSQESLKASAKPQNAKMNMVDAIRSVLDQGMEVTAGFIVGFDTDTPDIFDRQIDFINQALIPWAMVGTLTAIPGTRLWERLEKEGRILGYVDGDQFGRPNFRTTMDPDVLYSGYLKILETLYDPDAYYDRVLAVLDRHRRADLPNLHETNYPLLKVVGLFLMSVIILGIKVPYRRSFWRYLFRVILHHRKQFVQALVDAIIGHHFIRYTQEVLQRKRSLKPLGDGSRMALETPAKPAVAESLATRP
jgi:radical SAM superfamily enzyme YgiQ (UPF0313 family)